MCNRISENEDRISDQMGHQLTLREGASSNVIMTIKDLNNKKVTIKYLADLSFYILHKLLSYVYVCLQSTTTTAYERHWLQVTIPNAKKEDVNAHIGCNGCGKHCPNVETFKFYCDVCKAQCIAEKRYMLPHLKILIIHLVTLLIVYIHLQREF